jgi:hypothetical protein
MRLGEGTRHRRIGGERLPRNDRSIEMTRLKGAQPQFAGAEIGWRNLSF